jgi:pimeloyl-ACP methyl ester carboxylesterase
VVLLSGSGGGVSGAAGSLLAAHGFAVLDLAYFNYPGLPDHLVDIPLEYFREAIEWLRARLGHERIALQGASRGGEAVLAIAAAFPELVSAVVGVVPGDLYLVGSDGVNTAKPSWNLDGLALPRGMDTEEVAALQAPDLSKLSSAECVNTREAFFEPWYLDHEVYERTAIPIEQIQCPILLVSAADDQCWDSFHSSERAVERLRRKGFHHPVKHLWFEEAGHFLVAPGMPTSMVDAAYHPVLKMPFTMGGTPAATARAQRGFWRAAIRFYRDVLR